jgi:hypothetical protein
VAQVLSLLDGIEALSAQVDDLSGGLGAEVDEFNEALVPSAEALRVRGCARALRAGCCACVCAAVRVWAATCGLWRGAA